MSEAEKIAAGLTEAQRRHILLMKPGRSLWGKDYSQHIWSWVCEQLYGGGLAFRTWSMLGAHYHATPLGLEVSAILTRSRPDGNQ